MPHYRLHVGKRIVTDDDGAETGGDFIRYYDVTVEGEHSDDAYDQAVAAAKLKRHEQVIHVAFLTHPPGVHEANR